MMYILCCSFCQKVMHEQYHSLEKIEQNVSVLVVLIMAFLTAFIDSISSCIYPLSKPFFALTPCLGSR